MEIFISPNAARDFLRLSLLSYGSAIIGERALIQRLRKLVEFGSKEDESIAAANGIMDYLDWRFNSNSLFDSLRDAEPIGSMLEESETLDSPSFRDRTDDFALHLIMNLGPDRWDFHPFDNDWFPSIPHGHKKGSKSTVKLDPYLGLTYDGSKLCSKISKNHVVQLWNSEPFREMALRAIEFYLENHPGYKGWRVTNPRRLPRRK